MPSWGNGDNNGAGRQWDNDMIDSGDPQPHNLEVQGLTTCNGGVNAVGGLVSRRDDANTLHIAVEAGGNQLKIAWNEEAGPVIIGNPLDPANRVEVHPPLRLGVAEGVMNPFPGFIDANGLPAVGLPLNIGTRDTTSEVVMGSLLVPNAAVTLNVRLRLQGNAVILNNANDINDPDAFGMRYEQNGPGGIPAGLMIAGGNVVGWWDAEGVHVQPPAPPAP